MTPEQKNQIQFLVQERISETKLSNNQASVQIGINAAMLSHMLKNKWENVGDRTWLKAAQWVGYSASKEWVILGLPNYKRIQSLCKDAQHNHRLLAVAGNTGLGKTTAVKIYASKNANSYYTLATVTMGRKEFLTAIQRSIGLDVDGSLHKRIYAIINRLKTIENPLLILDDCGKLNDGCIRLIQVLFDELEGHLGLVLTGTEAFKSYIVKMASKDKMGFRELKRRVGFWQPMMELTIQVISQFAKGYGIEDKAALDYLQKNCDNLGTLKETLLNYARLVELYKSEGKVLTKTHREILANLNTDILNDAA
jgi:hypothetical protein